MKEKHQIKGRIAAFIFWIVLVFWMAFIFYMSAQTGSESARMSSPFAVRAAEILVPGYEEMTDEQQQAAVYKVEAIIRKTAHFTEYAILGFFAYLVVQLYISNRIKALFLAWGCSTLYAASDELHQLFVKGRSCQFRDVCIDSAGACAGAIVSIFIIFMIFLLKNKRHKPV